MAEWNRMERPSGDQSGEESGPGWETILLTPSSTRSRTKMSDVPPWMRSGLIVALKAILFASGDQAKLPTLKSLPLVRRLPGCGAARASATSTVQRWVCVYSRRTTW
jgi:hypothetical protein